MADDNDKTNNEDGDKVAISREVRVFEVLRVWPVGTTYKRTIDVLVEKKPGGGVGIAIRTTRADDGRQFSIPVPLGMVGGLLEAIKAAADVAVYGTARTVPVSAPAPVATARRGETSSETE